MMKVFIDTNVFLDYIQQRPEGWKEAEVIFFLAETLEPQDFLSKYFPEEI